MDQKQLRSQIKKHNEDFKERVQQGSFRIQCDSESDVLCFALTDYSPSAPVVSIDDTDPESTASLRVEHGTWRVVGFDVVNWRSSFLPTNPEAVKAFEPLIALVGRGDFKLEYDPSENDPLRLYVPAQVEELLDAA